MNQENKIIRGQMPSCGEQLLALRDGLEILGGKWKLLILHYLYNRKNEQNHFKKMQREIIGISAKMLTKELRDLVANFMVERTAHSDPHKIFYSISGYGETAIGISQAITQWGLIHRQKIKEHF